MAKMDRRKDDAINAKALAENKLAEMDAVGAKSFAMWAQTLYPVLDGLSQLLATLDIYISADKKINGDVDFYGVLDVPPSADHERIRENYRKLALIVHPDKNKSVGADGAFKILTEAWNVLSDKEKRAAYDQKRNLRGSCTNVLNGKSSASEPASRKVFHSFPKNNFSNASDKKGATYSGHAPPLGANNHTFRMACLTCKTNYEYLREFANLNLLCPHCKRPLLAAETPAPQPPPITMQPQELHQIHRTGLGGFSGLRLPAEVSLEGAFSGSGGSSINIGLPASFTAQSACVTHSASETLKCGHKELQTSTIKEEGLTMKFRPSRKPDTGLGTGFSNSVSNFAAKRDRPKKKRCRDEQEMGHEGNGLSRFQRTGSVTEKMSSVGISRTSSLREPLELGIQNMLIELAKKEICKTESGKPASLSYASNKPKAFDKGKAVKDEGNEKYAISMKPGAQKSTESVDINSSIQLKKSHIIDDGVDPATNESYSMSMNVPDPDFHDFDKDRSEKSFGENQVWAAYDDDDGMPRYYAKIHCVESLKRFKIRMSWLNSKSNIELAPLNWIGAGFSKTSGIFWIGKREVNRFCNSFSHKVKWSKATRGSIQIYPRKGNVWALYRNWSSDWNELTPIEAIHKYDMVEVVEDYSEIEGIAIVPLVKVAGFKTVFKRHPEPSTRWMVPKEELFRLSHQVPCYLLTGREGPNAPKGCLELDPAATPLELLQVLNEGQVKQMEDMVGKRLDLVGNDQKLKPNICVEDAIMEGEIKEEPKGKKPELLVYRRRKQRNMNSLYL